MPPSWTRRSAASIEDDHHSKRRAIQCGRDSKNQEPPDRCRDSCNSSYGVPASDSNLFRHINVLPDWVTKATWVPMQAGALRSPLSVAAVLAVRGNRHKAATVAMTGLATWLVAKDTKEVTGHTDPHGQQSSKF